jgi:hypothetical protein
VEDATKCAGEETLEPFVGVVTTTPLGVVVVATFTVSGVLKTAPVASHAWTMTLCVPVAIAREVLRVAALTVYTLLLSTYMRIAVMGELDFAEAANLAGEETVEPFVGDVTVTLPANERAVRVITASDARNRLFIDSTSCHASGGSATTNGRVEPIQSS